MALFFLRHGQTDWNRQHRWQAQSDVPLNAAGLAEAGRVAHALAARGDVFAACYASPLSRALVTARTVAARVKVAVTAAPAFIEIALGEYEGRRESDLREELGAAYDAWRATMFTVAAPGGESLRQARARVRDALAAAALHAQTKNVLIVAHQGINMAMKSELSGSSDPAVLQSFRQANDEVDIWCARRNKRLEQFRALKP
ncbi:MAG: histidine phosphatase family protein [Gammaproteobacteria bacterium]|nr:histidine phosphatase family protein [Gammaproteobacteria bacterium]MDD9800454.1 histidine phosphatase family protein [Gammaproteobacteria bacterium]MDD9815497.1 histidine phosphatase family protein [Gammaproteobacteria bacterium]MDD9850335.1 histidine phosphatase family protein [Gammaproteobacteria bacterium]MDD9871206.1 histidine phosphatase family protein [Gammaproteobacteria bacterium]